MRLFWFICMLAVAKCDINLHSPRGSNNRLNGQGRNRANNNRLFDSQNNNRGGHNVGSLPGRMVYYAGSTMKIQWANQHSCGDENNNCEVVIQYMCGDNVRDGTTTRTPPTNLESCENDDCETDERFGQHESYRYYQECRGRMRNWGLFTANQNPRSSATATRQNRNGQRRGYECAEERDYYPYWYPTSWKDIVVFTNSQERCDYYKAESENVKGRYFCEFPDEYWESFTNTNDIPAKVPLYETACVNAKVIGKDDKEYTGTWKTSDAHGIEAPDCKPSISSRDNHQGNAVGTGEFAEYDWVIPDLDEDHCVIRIRYNISTGDYPAWETDGTDDENLRKAKRYPSTIFTSFGMSDVDATRRRYFFSNDPKVDIFDTSTNGNDGFRLQVAMQTNQFGRTFQDRSHVIQFKPKPEAVGDATVHNVNVRGKRGNIVQVYPSVEYDFVPNVLEVNVGDFIHFQWTGSDLNPRQNAGQGTRGQDRSNVVQLSEHFNSGIHSRFSTNYFDFKPFLGLTESELEKLALDFDGSTEVSTGGSSDGSYVSVMVSLENAEPGTYYYMSSINNAFTNRDQKAKIIVI